MDVWYTQDVVNILSEEWEQAYTDLETATIKSVAQRFGVWPQLEEVLLEDGWSTSI